MSEFYVDLSDEEILSVIAGKVEMYKDYFIGRYHDVQLGIHDIEYRCYGHHNGLESGSFELYRYVGMCEGVELYRFCVKKPVTKESREVREERERERDERRREIDRCQRKRSIKRKFEQMKAKDLDEELKTRGISTKDKRSKGTKVNALVDHDLL